MISLADSRVILGKHKWNSGKERLQTERKKKGKTSRKCKYHQTQIFSMLAEFVSKTSQASHVFCGNANRWLSFATKTYLWVLIIRFYIQHHLRRTQSRFLFRNPQILVYSSNKLTLFISKFHWTFVSEQKFDEIALFVQRNFRSKSLELSFELLHEISTKVQKNKTGNSCISLALLLHSTVHLIFQGEVNIVERSPRRSWSDYSSIVTKPEANNFCY